MQRRSCRRLQVLLPPGLLLLGFLTPVVVELVVARGCPHAGGTIRDLQGDDALVVLFNAVAYAVLAATAYVLLGCCLRWSPATRSAHACGLLVSAAAITGISTFIQWAYFTSVYCTPGAPGSSTSCIALGLVPMFALVGGGGAYFLGWGVMWVVCEMMPRVEGPRCSVCGYLLIGLSDTRCPDCGERFGPPPDTFSVEGIGEELKSLREGQKKQPPQVGS